MQAVYRMYVSSTRDAHMHVFDVYVYSLNSPHSDDYGILVFYSRR